VVELLVVALRNNVKTAMALASFVLSMVIIIAKHI
jgi:hypothetical protein